MDDTTARGHRGVRLALYRVLYLVADAVSPNGTAEPEV